MDSTYDRYIDSYLDAAFDAGAEGASDDVLHELAENSGVVLDDSAWRRGVAALLAGQRS